MNQTAGAIDPMLCPLCGSANECGMAGATEKCWCFNAIIPEDVLGRVPEQARDLACICERCAKQTRAI
jgi:hypothetical protein